MKIIVWDDPLTNHGKAVAQAVRYGYGIDKDIQDEISIIKDFNDVVGMLDSNKGRLIEGVVRSTSGLRQSKVDIAQRYYPYTLWFYPLQDNVFHLVNKFSVPEPPVIVVAGCGDNENRNNTSYGNGLEFWDADWNWFDPGQDAVSFANGFIAGKLLRLKHELMLKYPDKNFKNWWWVARYIMRMTSYKTEPNRTTHPWDLHNGYGRPSWQIALWKSYQYIDEIPNDPYYTDLGDVGELHLQLTGFVDIRADMINGAKKYQFFRNDILIKETIKPYANDTLKTPGVYKYSYLGIDIDGNKTEMSDIKIVNFMMKQKPKKIHTED